MFLNDGFSTYIVMIPGGNNTTGTAVPGTNSATAVYFKEREVTPMSIEVGSIDTQTMKNVRFRTKHNKHLATIGDASGLVNYDVGPGVIPTLIGTYIGVQMYIAVWFPDNSFWKAPGWLDDFKPQALKEGDFPLAEVKFVFSMTRIPGVGVNPVEDTIYVGTGDPSAVAGTPWPFVASSPSGEGIGTF